MGMNIIGIDYARAQDGYPVGSEVLLDAWFFPTEGGHPYIELSVRVEILSVPERIEATRSYYDDNMRKTAVENPRVDSIYGQWVRLLEPIREVAGAGTETFVRLSHLRPIV